MTILISPLPMQSFRDNNGNPLAGGLLYTYQAGTSTLQSTYTDATGTTPNANPVVLNSRGEASVWLTSAQAFKLVLQDSYGVLIWSVDQVASSASSGANSDISSLSGLTTALSVPQGGTGAITATAAADALGAFRRGTLLGAVSQAAGVPTGAVIERGSNANGEYVRFADGTQICTNTLPDLSVAANANANINWAYPAVFAGANPRVPAWIGVPSISGDVYGFVYTQGIGLTNAIQAFKNGGTAQLLSQTQAIAIGRWF